jgi:hypothetical protein
MVASTPRRGRLVLVALVLPLLLLLLAPTSADADVGLGGERLVGQVADAETQLAERHAPEVRLVAQPEPCGPGEPYEPIDVDALMDSEEVALRGPWDRVNLIGVGPSAEEIGVGLPGYHLDFPGDALRPGCSFEEYQERMTAGLEPTMYARVVPEAGRLALQYWFFYVYNDWNNTHEGDWEMIQLVFDAATATEALATDPVEAGYSQHEGAERAAWDDDKLERVDGTRPVVYPARGSHAGFFSSALYLGASAETGVGCDDTNGPHRALQPRVAVVPADEESYLQEFPWLGFEGRWGEQREAFFNGPTGPNDKRQWTEPIGWSQDTWREDSVPVPLGSVLGQNATGAFCTVVATGSEVLRVASVEPVTVVTVLGVLLLLVFGAASRTSWGPAAPLPMVRTRSWGQILVSARRAYGLRRRVFLKIGLIHLGVAVLASGLQQLLFRGTRLEELREAAGSTDGYVVGMTLYLSAALTLVAFVVMLAATAWSLSEIDAGREVTLRSAYRRTLQRLPTLVAATAAVVTVVLLLSLTVVGLPLAVFVLVRRVWAVHAIMIEDLPPKAALRRSRELVSGRFLPTAWVVALVTGIGALSGPAVGMALLLASPTSFAFVNAAAALAYAVTLPFVALALTYCYADLRAGKERREASQEPVAAGA